MLDCSIEENKISPFMVHRIKEIELQGIHNIFSEMNVKIINIDSNNFSNRDSFISLMKEKLELPNFVSTYDGYLDFARDLSWYWEQNYQGICVIFEKFIRKESEEVCQQIIFDFETVIFPFWKEEVATVVMSGRSMPFYVYIV